MKPSQENRAEKHATDETIRIQQADNKEDAVNTTLPKAHRRSSRKTSIRVRHQDVK